MRSSYACWTFWNSFLPCSTRAGSLIRSGWCFSTNLRCARLTSSESASLLTPRASYGSGGRGEVDMSKQACYADWLKKDTASIKRWQNWPTVVLFVVLMVRLTVWRSTEGQGTHFGHPELVGRNKVQSDIKCFQDLYTAGHKWCAGSGTRPCFAKNRNRPVTLCSVSDRVDWRSPAVSRGRNIGGVLVIVRRLAIGKSFYGRNKQT